MVIGVAIVAIIGAAVVVGITQVFRGSTSSSDRMTAINNVRNAGDWITQDARMSLGSVTISPVDHCPSMSWTYYDPLTSDPPTSFSVVYTLSGTADLVRSYTVGMGAPSVITVARNITVNSATFSTNNFTITLTATAGSVSETRTFSDALRNLPQ